MRQDCGKKAFWEEGLVLKKAIKPQRCRLCPGFDGTWCKVKIFSATEGQEKGLHPWRNHGFSMFFLKFGQTGHPQALIYTIPFRPEPGLNPWHTTFGVGVLWASVATRRSCCPRNNSSKRRLEKGNFAVSSELLQWSGKWILVTPTEMEEPSGIVDQKLGFNQETGNDKEFLLGFLNHQQPPMWMNIIL